MTTRLSLSMIVRDEEATIARVLCDVREICDEIIVVDTGSSDGTIELAKSLGAQVFAFEWTDNFSAARNFSLSKCHGDWILWLDADDRVPPRSRDAIAQIRAELEPRTDIDAVFIPYRREFLPPDSDNCTLSIRSVRMFRNHVGISWTGAIHEFVDRPDGAAIPSLVKDEAWVEHRPMDHQVARKIDRNISILKDLLDVGERSVRNLRSYATELMERTRYSEAYEIFEEIVLLAPDGDRYRVLCAYAECARCLGREDEHRALLMKAVMFDGGRAEAFVQLGESYFRAEEWARAMPFFSAATVLDRPTITEGPVFEPSYSYLPWDYLAVCANKLGRQEDALQFIFRALAGNPERERLLQNIRLSLDDLGR